MFLPLKNMAKTFPVFYLTNQGAAMLVLTDSGNAERITVEL
jgi:hypothetical protein